MPRKKRNLIGGKKALEAQKKELEVQRKALEEQAIRNQRMQKRQSRR
jgi:hypothetical protein